jgi:hypothetical protein
MDFQYARSQGAILTVEDAESRQCIVARHARLEGTYRKASCWAGRWMVWEGAGGASGKE